MTTFTDFMENKFLAWQAKEGKRKTLKDFAEYLEVKPQLLSMWMSGSRTPSEKQVPKLADHLGPEVYTLLGLVAPDPILTYIIARWERLEPADQHAVLEQVEKYSTKDPPEELR